MRRKIPEPWAAWVCGPNRDKEVFASMADETKTNATPEAPGGPPPPAPEQTEQARALFTTLCFIGDINPDTAICDNMLLELYNDSDMESVDISYDEFDLYMCELLV